METDRVPMILREDDYHSVLRTDQLQPGDLVLYRNDRGEMVHIGVVLAIEPDIETASFKVMVLSKWGGEGEYVHAQDRVPSLLGHPSEYLSERRLVS